MQNPQSKSRELQAKVQNHHQTPDFQQSRQVVFQKTETEKTKLRQLKMEWKRGQHN